jgi:hypothetical protein
MPASYGRNFPGSSSVARLFTSFFLSDEARFIAALPFPPVEVTATRPSLLDFARQPALWGNGGASLTGFSRATHAWGRPSAWTPAHALTAVTTVSPRRDPATACRPLGGHGPAVTAVTAGIVRIRIPRAVTAVIIAPAVTTVARRAFVTCSGGHGPPWPP